MHTQHKRQMISSTKIILLLFILSLNTPAIFAQKIAVPEYFSIIDSISGDLDNDAHNELVVAFNTAPEKDFESIPRMLIIYKSENGKWIEWKKSKLALYGSRDGGMMGDPYGEMEIKNGILLISQNGGSSWKWGHTDKYRYQNGDFYLIGYASNYGKPCEYWTYADFNLSTGKLVITKEYEECETSEQNIYKRENETTYKKGLTLTLQNRNKKEIKIITPKYKHEIYLAVNLDEPN